MRQMSHAKGRLILLDGGGEPESCEPARGRERILDLWEDVVSEVYSIVSFVISLALAWLVASALTGDWKPDSLWKALVCPAMTLPLAHVMAGAATGAGSAARESLEHAILLVSRVARNVRTFVGR